MCLIVYVYFGDANVVVKRVSNVDCHAGAVYGNVFNA